MNTKPWAPTGQGTPRRPFRVYCAGDGEMMWRRSLVTPQYQGMLGNYLPEDTKLPAALPYAHDYVGPFQVRVWANRKDAYMTSADDHRAELQRLAQLRTADAVFVWLSNFQQADLGIEVGIAHESRIPVYVAASREEFLQSVPLLDHVIKKSVIQPTALEGFREVMADVDVTFRDRAPRLSMARQAGRCVACQSGYEANASLFWVKDLGGMHPDCFWQADIRTAGTLAAMPFNAELVAALREDNARLEAECLKLMTEKSELDRKLLER